MSKKTLLEWIRKVEARDPDIPHGPAMYWPWYGMALMARLGLEGLDAEGVEAKIARWEALEAMCLQGGQLNAEAIMKLRAAGAQALPPTINAELAKAQIAGNRCGKGAAALLGAVRACCRCGFSDPRFTLQPYDGSSWCVDCLLDYQESNPPRSDDPTRVDHSTECGCGGPAGHVPNGLLCRKGLR